MSGDRYIITEQQAPYFVTFTVVDWVDVFTRPHYKQIITDNLNYCIQQKGLTVYAWCLMSNHLHAIVQAKVPFMLSDIIRDYKKFTSKAIVELIQAEPESRRDWMLHRFEFAGKADSRIKNYKFWQEGNHAILLDAYPTGKFDQRLNYIHENPVRAGIVVEPQDYLYSSARDYAGLKGLVDIVLAV